MPNVVLEGLRPGTGYMVQVRARTVAGYGAYSKEMLFQTLTDGECVGGWLECVEARVCGGRFYGGEERECRTERECERFSKSENLAAK